MAVVDTGAKAVPLKAMCCYTSLLWLTSTTAVTSWGTHATEWNSVTTTQYTFRTKTDPSYKEISETESVGWDKN